MMRWIALALAMAACSEKGELACHMSVETYCANRSPTYDNPPCNADELDDPPYCGLGKALCGSWIVVLIPSVDTGFGFVYYDLFTKQLVASASGGGLGGPRTCDFGPDEGFTEPRCASSSFVFGKCN